MEKVAGNEGRKTFPDASAINRVIACHVGMLGIRWKIVLTLISYFFFKSLANKTCMNPDETSNTNTVVLGCVL